MKWHEVALILLANDLLLFGISAIVGKIKNRRLDEVLSEVYEVDENVDRELEERALEATTINKDELGKLSKAQLFILDEWIGNELERKK